MNEVNQSTNATSAAYAASTSTTSTTKAASDKTEVKGAGTYGSPKLSDKALDYYNQLKKKYGSLNFVLVSSDKKQEAEMMKGSFARGNALTVLIDTDKIEQMAEDENYRKQIEGTIDNAVNGVSKLAASLGGTKNVAAYGMTINKDGTASMFAVIDKSLAAQKARIEKKSEEKRETQKAEEKKAAKDRAARRSEDGNGAGRVRDEDQVTITANSVEELLQKIQDYEQNYLTDNVRTQSEQAMGQSVDYYM